jgi:DNA-binding transcriptional LysR family regulator
VIPENNDREWGTPAGGRAFSWKELDEYCQHVLSDIVTVELIGRLQSKTKAADILNMTLPAIRSRLMPVERTLKGSVAERGRNGELSPLGLKMRKFWEDIRGPLENFIVEVERLHDLDTLRLGIPQSIWESERKWLEPDYEARMPGGSIQPVFADGFHTIESQVRDGTFDVGVVSFAPLKQRIAPPVILRFWRNEPMVLVVEYQRAAMRLSNRSKATPEDLRGLHHTFFTMPENSGMYNAVNEYLKKFSAPFRYKVPVRNESEALTAVIADKGVSILPQPAVEKAADDLKFDEFLLAPALVRPLALLYREHSLKEKSVAAFLECIERHDKQSKRAMLG